MGVYVLWATHKKAIGLDTYAFKLEYMANSHLISAIQRSLMAFECQQISIAELQEVLEANGSALEGIESADYSQLHNFSNDLERIRFTCLQENQHEEACVVIQDLHKFLETLSK